MKSEHIFIYITRIMFKTPQQKTLSNRTKTIKSPSSQGTTIRSFKTTN